MEKSNTYCIMSHTGMALQNNADFCCCNLNKESWKDNKHEVIRVYSHPLKTAFKSYSRKLIATKITCPFYHISEKGQVIFVAMNNSIIFSQWKGHRTIYVLFSC